MPSYSIPSAMRISVASTRGVLQSGAFAADWKDKGRWFPDPPPRYSFRRRGSGQLGDQRLGFGFLLIVALVQHFLENFARAFDIAHFLIRLGEIELGRGIVPLAIEHRRRRVLEGRALRIEGKVELVELDRRGRT